MQNEMQNVCMYVYFGVCTHRFSAGTLLFVVRWRQNNEFSLSLEIKRQLSWEPDSWANAHDGCCRINWVCCKDEAYKRWQQKRRIRTGVYFVSLKQREIMKVKTKLRLLNNSVSFIKYEGTFLRGKLPDTASLLQVTTTCEWSTEASIRDFPLSQQTIWILKWKIIHKNKTNSIHDKKLTKLNRHHKSKA